MIRTLQFDEDLFPKKKNKKIKLFEDDAGNKLFQKTNPKTNMKQLFAENKKGELVDKIGVDNLIKQYKNKTK